MINKAIESTRDFFRSCLGLDVTVVGVTPTEEGWQVLAEAVVEDDYMRRRARRDLVGLFEVTMSKKYEVQSYIRREIRERGTVVTRE